MKARGFWLALGLVAACAATLYFLLASDDRKSDATSMATADEIGVAEPQYGSASTPEGELVDVYLDAPRDADEAGAPNEGSRATDSPVSREALIQPVRAPSESEAARMRRYGESMEDFNDYAAAIHLNHPSPLLDSLQRYALSAPASGYDTLGMARAVLGAANVSVENAEAQPVNGELLGYVEGQLAAALASFAAILDEARARFPVSPGLPQYTDGGPLSRTTALQNQNAHFRRQAEERLRATLETIATAIEQETGALGKFNPSTFVF